MRKDPIENSLSTVARALSEAVEGTPRGTLDIFPNGYYTTMIFNSKDADRVYSIIQSLPDRRAIKVIGNKAHFADGKGLGYASLEDILYAFRGAGFEVAVAR